MDLILEALLKLGATGLVGGVLWIIAKRFMDETVNQMTARIDALEITSKECESDRKALHAQVVAILQKDRGKG